MGHGSYKLRVVMRIKEGPTKILNLMTPWAAGVFELGHGLYESYSENAVFLLLFFSTLGHGSDEMITREGSSKIVNFMTPGAGVHFSQRW